MFKIVKRYRVGFLIASLGLFVLVGWVLAIWAVVWSIEDYVGQRQHAGLDIVIWILVGLVFVGSTVGSTGGRRR